MCEDDKLTPVIGSEMVNANLQRSILSLDLESSLPEFTNLRNFLGLNHCSGKEGKVGLLFGPSTQPVRICGRPLAQKSDLPCVAAHFHAWGPLSSTKQLLSQACLPVFLLALSLLIVSVD